MRQYTVIIRPIISLAPATLPSGTGGVAYNQTLTASGGAAPYNFALTGGSLPPGISLTSSGVLAGTPSGQGSFNFSVTATDNNGFSGLQAYTLIIASPLTLNPTTLNLAGRTTTQSYTQNFAVANGTAPYSLQITGGSVPPGLTFLQSGATARLAGTPTIAGTFSVFSQFFGVKWQKPDYFELTRIRLP